MPEHLSILWNIFSTAISYVPDFVWSVSINYKDAEISKKKKNR